jgi:hypothetical protein
MNTNKISMAAAAIETVAATGRNGGYQLRPCRPADCRAYD